MCQGVLRFGGTDAARQKISMVWLHPWAPSVTEENRGYNSGTLARGAGGRRDGFSRLNNLRFHGSTRLGVARKKSVPRKSERLAGGTKIIFSADWGPFSILKDQRLSARTGSPPRTPPN